MDLLLMNLFDVSLINLVSGSGTHPNKQQLKHGKLSISTIKSAK